jgi:hypothetical protein
MQAEAVRRLAIIKGFYNESEEARIGSVAYWKTVETVQALRRQASSAAAGEKRKSKKGISSGTDEDEEFDTKKKKRERVLMGSRGTSTLRN